MKKSGLTRWRIAFLAFFMAYFWLFPPNLFRDCIHVAFFAARTDDTSDCSGPDGAPDCAHSDDTPDGACPDAETNCTLTEEDYLDLFHMGSSEYKIAWKFLQND